jgi:hypothetical protein
MVSGVGLQSTYSESEALGNAVALGSSGQAATLNGEIRRDQVQLNDWVACLSANTPKGKAEIQSLSTRISAAKQHIARLDAEQGAAGASAVQHSRSTMPSAMSYTAKAAVTAASTQKFSRPGGLVDTWA